MNKPELTPRQCPRPPSPPAALAPSDDALRRVAGRADILFDNFRVRPVRPADREAIVAMISRVYGEYRIIFDLDGYDKDLREPGAACRTNGGEFWVVERDGRIVATVAVTLHGTGGARVGELKRLYVDKSARGHGLGPRLTRLAMDYARAAGCTRFEAWSDTVLTHARAMYRGMGFTQQGERPLNDINQAWEYGFHLDLQNAAPQS